MTRGRRKKPKIDAEKIIADMARGSKREGERFQRIMQRGRTTEEALRNINEIFGSIRKPPSFW